MRGHQSVHSKIVSWRAVMTQWITKQESASLSEQRDNSPYEYKVFTSSLSMVHTRAWPRIEPSTKIHFRSHFRGFFINMYIYL